MHANATKAGNLRDRLGQFFIFGLPGPRLDAKTRQHLEETKPGSFILFRRNLQNNRQVAELTNELHQLSLQMTSVPAFIGLDQEGGKVVRIPFRPPLPSAHAVGQIQDPEITEMLGYQIGVALKQLGFNLNFAPVLDLGNDRQYSFLGQRALSSDPKVVADLGLSFTRGHLRAGILPVAKHFPGIGPIPNDPHLSLVRRPVSLDDLKTRDLLPFEAFAKIPQSGMMISHLIYPRIDENPGTFSSVIIQDLLRHQMKYQGLVITDDLMMEGAQASKSFDENILRAFNAGADLLMISWSIPRQRQAVAALARALDDGKIKTEDVLSRLQRIESLKREMALKKPARAHNADLLLVYNFRSYENLVDRILQKSLERNSRTLSDLRAERLLVLREQSELLKRISGRANIRQSTVEKLQSTLAQELKDPESGNKSYWVYFVRNRNEDQIAKDIPKEVRSRLLLVNLWRPDLKSGSFQNQIEIFMSHPRRDEMLADWINEKMKAKPNQARLLPSPVHPEPSATLLRSESHSKADSPVASVSPDRL